MKLSGWNGPMSTNISLRYRLYQQRRSNILVNGEEPIMVDLF